jgi:hypothetical protein
MTEELIVMMTEAEARERVNLIKNKIKDHVGEEKRLVLDLYEREGWRALGYNSWRDCVLHEFEGSQSRLYELLDEARVERNISDVSEVPVTARIAKVLKNLEPDQQRSVIKEAEETAPEGKITDEFLQKVKEKTIPRKPTKRDLSRAKRERLNQEKKLKGKPFKDLTAKVKSGDLTPDQAIVEMVNREKSERENTWERCKITSRLRSLFEFDPVDQSAEDFAKGFVAKVNWEDLKPHRAPWDSKSEVRYLDRSRLQRCIAVITKIAELMPDESVKAVEIDL